MADEIMEAGFPADRVRLLPNGVNLSVFNPPSADEQRAARLVIGLENSSIIYLFVGRLVGLKRVDLLLDAWAALDCSDRGTLLIVGALDTAVVTLNESALNRLRCPKSLVLVPGATPKKPASGLIA